MSWFAVGVDSFAAAPRVPRAVAGVPVVDAGEVTKAWLLELVAAAPLEAAAALPTGELVDFGPALSTAVVEALRDDAALARLLPGGELGALAARAGSLVGTSEPAAVIAAVESLRRAVLASMLAAARLDALTTAELVDRLAHVCTLVATAALTSTAKAEKKAAKKRQADAVEAAAAIAVPAAAAARSSAPPPIPEPPADEPPAPETAAEIDVEPPPPARAEPRAPEREQPAAQSPPIAPTPRAAPPRPPAVAAPSFDPLPPAGGETVEVHRVDDPLEALRVRQARQAEPLSWRQAVEWRIKRHLQDDSPFALLAVEVDNVARLLAADEGGEVGGLLGGPRTRARRRAAPRRSAAARRRGPLLGHRAGHRADRRTAARRAAGRVGPRRGFASRRAAARLDRRRQLSRGRHRRRRAGRARRSRAVRRTRRRHDRRLAALLPSAGGDGRRLDRDGADAIGTRRARAAGLPRRSGPTSRRRGTARDRPLGRRSCGPCR